MADYQSLLTRAVANLPSPSPAAARQAIYDRARKALLTQLRTLRPPLPESDITREENALNHAIAQVEAKFGGADAAHAEPTPSRTAPSAPGQPAGERPPPAAPPRPAPGSQPPVSASATASKPQAAPGAPAPTAPTQAAPAPPAAPARAATPAASTPRPAGVQTQPRPEPARAPAPAGAQQNAPVAPVRPAQAPANQAQSIRLRAGHFRVRLRQKRRLCGLTARRSLERPPAPPRHSSPREPKAQALHRPISRRLFHPPSPRRVDPVPRRWSHELRMGRSSAPLPTPRSPTIVYRPRRD